MHCLIRELIRLYLPCLLTQLTKSMESRYIPALEHAGWSDEDIAICSRFFITNRLSPPQVAPSVDLDRKLSLDFLTPETYSDSPSSL